MDHVAKVQVDAYWGRRLTPADLLELDFHLGECSRCRETLMAAAPPASFPMLQESEGHLEYDQIEACVKETASAEERAAVESHIAGCVACREELEDLSGFRVRNALKPRKMPRKMHLPLHIRLHWWLAALLAAACVAALLIHVGK